MCRYRQQVSLKHQGTSVRRHGASVPVQTTGFSETSGHFCQTTRRDSPDDGSLHKHDSLCEDEIRCSGIFLSCVTSTDVVVVVVVGGGEIIIIIARLNNAVSYKVYR